jgi:hypothetical protein
MCEAIGEARRHRPCLRGTAFGACSSALRWLFYVLGVKNGCVSGATARSERSSGMNFMHAENLGPWGIARRSDATERHDSPDDSQLHSPQTQTRDHRPIHRDRHADMDLADMDLAAIWRSDVICCKTPETTPPRAEPCEAQSGALWTLQSADSHHLDSACSVCLRKGYWDQTATNHLSITRKGWSIELC